MSEAISLAIAVGVRLYAEGLSASLARFPGLSVVGCAREADAVRALLREKKPEVVLLDVGLSHAGELVEDTRTISPGTRVLALGVREVEEDVIACAELGCAGYVPRDDSLNDLAAAIERAASGELNCSPRIAGSLFRRVATTTLGKPSWKTGAGTLTRREREIVGLIERGLSNKQIARRLEISTSTVKSHVHNILTKLNVTRRGAAAATIRMATPEW